jgi:hypothetical protein
MCAGVYVLGGFRCGVDRIRSYVANMAALANEVAKLQAMHCRLQPEVHTTPQPSHHADCWLYLSGSVCTADEEADDDWEDVDDDDVAAEVSVLLVCTACLYCLLALPACTRLLFLLC